MGYHVNSVDNHNTTLDDIEHYCKRVDAWKERIRIDHGHITTVTEILKSYAIDHGTYQCAINAYPGTKAAEKPLVIYIKQGNGYTYLRRSEKFDRWYLYRYSSPIKAVFSDIYDLMGIINEIQTLELITDKDATHTIKRL